MSDSTLSVGMLSGSAFNVFAYNLREMQALPTVQTQLTDDQLVFAAAALQHIMRNEVSIGGMRIYSPSDLVMPEVLEYVYSHRYEAEMAGAYMLAFTGSIANPTLNRDMPAAHIRLYDQIGRNCLRVAAAGYRSKEQRDALNSISNDYTLVRRQITALARYMAKKTVKPRLS